MTKFKNLFSATLLGLGLTLVTSVQAQRADLEDPVHEEANLPKGLVVRVDNKTKKSEVFTSAQPLSEIKDAKVAAKINEKVAIAANKVSIESGAEIEDLEPKAAWCFWYQPFNSFYPFYSFNNFGVNYFYQPVSYYYTTPVYTYYYYYPSCNWGGHRWNSCW